MSNKRNSGRQEVIAAFLTLETADFNNAAGTLQVNGVQGNIDLPEGAVVQSAVVNVTEAVAGSGVGVTLALAGGGVTLAGVDVDAAAASFAGATLDGQQVGSGGTSITCTVAGGDTTIATAGSVDIIVTYVVSGRTAFSQG